MSTFYCLLLGVFVNHVDIMEVTSVSRFWEAIVGILWCNFIRTVLSFFSDNDAFKINLYKQ